MQQLFFSNDVSETLTSVLDGLADDATKIFILTDEHVRQRVLPLLSGNPYLERAALITVRSGDMHKDLDALQSVWTGLQRGNATRQSLLVNIGGGMVTDMGGFAAATFKRGICFVNVPTTLLGAVDAAVGGKTGINFNGMKNELGAFREAEAVVISTSFFRTLPEKELKSGYAEMIKHGLLSGEAAFRQLLQFDISNPDHEQLLDMLRESVEVKRRIVAEDPCEHGIRKALNLGHTAGHAFESLAMRRNAPVPHGYAVAWGLVVEAVLSKLEKGMDSAILYTLADYVVDHYGVFKITCKDYPELLELMRHDKKSIAGEYNFSLIRRPGDIEVDCRIDEPVVESALDIYCDLMHI